MPVCYHVSGGSMENKDRLLEAVNQLHRFERQDVARYLADPRRVLRPGRHEALIARIESLPHWERNELARSLAELIPHPEHTPTGVRRSPIEQVDLRGNHPRPPRRKAYEPPAGS